jgi:hypothetical protein
VIAVASLLQVSVLAGFGALILFLALLIACIYSRPKSCCCGPCRFAVPAHLCDA